VRAGAGKFLQNCFPHKLPHSSHTILPH
jgi:hypothetical protein